MKTLSIVIIAVLALSFIASCAMAEETSNTTGTQNITNYTETQSIDNATENVEEVTETEAELELDEDAGAGKIAWKQMQLWFTFNQERKLEREMDLARLRLIQAKIAAKNNNSAAMEKALEAHDRILERARRRMEAIKLVSDAKGIDATALKIVGLERAIQVHEKRIAFISNVLANANLTEAQREKLEARLAKVENVTAKLGELNQAKQEQIKTRLMAVKNMTEDEAEKLIEQKRAKIKSRIKEKLSNLRAEPESQ